MTMNSSLIEARASESEVGTGSWAEIVMSLVRRRVVQIKHQR